MRLDLRILNRTQASGLSSDVYVTGCSDITTRVVLVVAMKAFSMWQGRRHSCVLARSQFSLRIITTECNATRSPRSFFVTQSAPTLKTHNLPSSLHRRSRAFVLLHFFLQDCR